MPDLNVTEPTEFRWVAQPFNGGPPIYSNFVVLPTNTAATCTALSVAGVNTGSGAGPNPTSVPPADTGDTLLFLSVSNGPTPDPAGTIQAPTGANLVYSWDGDGYVPRIRIWKKDHDGTASYTFGGNAVTIAGVDTTVNTAIIAFDGAADITAPVTNTADNAAVMAFAPVQASAGDLVLPFMVVQNSDADDVTAGPAGYTEIADRTNPEARRGYNIWQRQAAADGFTTPGNVTLAGTSSAHIGFTVVAACSTGVTTPTCTVATQPVNVTGAIGDLIDFGGSCSGSCGSTQWQQRVGGAWQNETGPPASITAGNIGQVWRFVCGVTPSDSVTISQSSTTTNMGVQTVVLTGDGSTAVANFAKICPGNTQQWQIGIVEPFDPDPQNPAGGAWQDLDAADGFETIGLQAQETWIDGFDPDIDGHTFSLKVRASCDGTTWDEGEMRIEA